MIEAILSLPPDPIPMPICFRIPFSCLLLIAITFAGKTALGQNATADTTPLSQKLKAEGVDSLAKAARERGSAIRGAILFPQQQLGCANCHVTGGNDLLGPDLSTIGAEATDAYLVEALLYPSRFIRKGFETVAVRTMDGEILNGRIVRQNDDLLTLRSATDDRRLITLPRASIDEIAPSQSSSMPDGLVDQLADRQQFLDLVRYSIELKEAGPSAPAPIMTTQRVTIDDELRGLVLLDQYQCRKCHQDDRPANAVPPYQTPHLEWFAGRINPGYIERFIGHPHLAKPGTTMPDVLGKLSEEERERSARELTHYIVSLRDTSFRKQPLDAAAAERGGELFHTVGCVACHAPQDATPELQESSQTDRSAGK